MVDIRRDNIENDLLLLVMRSFMYYIAKIITKYTWFFLPVVFYRYTGRL